VNQGEWRMKTTNGTKMYTFGLTTCTALGFTIGNKEFLAHIDAETNVNDVIVYIILHNQKRNIPITSIKIWTGAGTNSNDQIKPYDPSRESFAKVRLILKYLKRLGLTLSKPHKIDACYAEIVS
jgi:hypothetical protein